MEENMQLACGAYDLIPSSVLLARRGGPEGWQCAYQNPPARRLLDGRERELLDAVADGLDRAAAGEGEPSWSGDLWDRHLRARLSPGPEGTCLIMLWDVTEEVLRQHSRMEAANAALKSALDAANAASKAKSDFLSNMSHDIRTPLNAIIGMTTIAQAHLDEQERVEDCLEKISLSSRHLLGLINDILDMSRIESGKMTLTPENFTMAEFIHALMAVFRPQADRKRQKVVLDFSGIRHEQVRGDQLRIQQVLINILSNAVKFTPEDGTITMRVREKEQLSKAGHNYAYYEFMVEDNGMGMSPEFLRRIFQPFERGDRVNRIEGTGLGMTITHNLVEMMNGEITVESEEGKGSRFTVTLPLEQITGEDTDWAELRGLRVLAADSDRAALDNLQEILADLGMECDLCPSALAASELAAQARMEGRDYFAILLSWHLPVVDGVQACRELRAMLGDKVPILLMSSYEWTLSADEMRKHGISAFVPKPLFRSRLGEALYAFTPAGLAKNGGARSLEDTGFAGFHVLLVEDNEINQEIGMELIEMLGATVECAENGQEAVDRFRSSPEGGIDLIFMDIQMPVMNGFEATRAIRALPRADSATVPIVAMSANAFVEDIRACERAGMNDHVPKPVSLQHLEEVMGRFLDRGREPGRPSR